LALLEQQNPMVYMKIKSAFLVNLNSRYIIRIYTVFFTPGSLNPIQDGGGEGCACRKVKTACKVRTIQQNFLFISFIMTTMRELKFDR